jgi:hypothetical protein
VFVYVFFFLFCFSFPLSLRPCVMNISPYLLFYRESKSRLC